MPVVNPKEQQDSLFVRCTCHSHILEIRNDDYCIEDGCAANFDINIWDQSPVPYSFGNRLWMIWRLLIGKRLDGGDVIVTQEDANAIIEFLNRKLSENQVKSDKYAKSK